MNFVLFILIGLIAGALAGKIVSGHGFGFLGDIVVGVIGAFLGGWLGGELVFRLGVGVHQTEDSSRTPERPI